MRPDRSATFKLPDQPGCKRGFAEDWLARMEVEDKAKAVRVETVETNRFHYIFWPALLAALAAILRPGEEQFRASSPPDRIDNCLRSRPLVPARSGAEAFPFPLWNSRRLARLYEGWC